MYPPFTGIIIRSILLQLAGILIPVMNYAQPGIVTPLSNDYYFSVKVDSSAVKERLQKAGSIANTHPDSAIQQYWQAFRESKQISYNHGTSIALNQLGLLYSAKAQYDSALLLFRNSITYAKSAGKTISIAAPYVNIGNIYFYRAHYELALNEYYKALDAVSNYQFKLSAYDSFTIYKNIALSWSRMGSINRAQEAITVIEAIAGKSDNSAMQAEFYSIAGAVFKNNDKKKAIIYLQKALASDAYLEKIDDLLSSINSIAHTYIHEGNTDSARFYVDEAFKLLEQYPKLSQYNRMHTWDNLGHIYNMEGKHTAAEKIWRTVAAQAQSARLIDMVMHMAPNLADNYATMGRYQKAYEYLLQYIKVKDSVTGEQKNQSMELWVQSHLAQKEKIVLEQKLHIAKQENLLRKKNFWIGSSVLGALLLLVTLVTLVRNYQHKQKLQTAALTQLRNEQEINQLKALVRGEEQERSRIAIELHDGIASELWGIKLNVSSLREQEKTGDIQLDRWRIIYQQLDHAAQKVRTTAHNLMPDLLLDKGLVPALSTLCQRLKAQTGLAIEFQEYGHIARMNEEIELSLYRMIQELIQNVLKHATGATQLLVQVSCTEELLNITIEDNGAGFVETPAMAAQGFGLGNIRKRVATLQGHFELKSQEGIGTTAYLEFDIHHLL